MNKVVQNRKKVMLFDLSNLIMRCLFAYPVKPHEKEFKEFKAIFMRLFLKTIKDNCPEKIICCMDNTSWRKDVSESYKENRKAFRAKSIVDFDVFFPISNKLIEALKDCAPNIQFLDVPKCEADDLIAVITRSNPDWDIINISTDHDFYQLYKFPNYKQYDGMMHNYVEVLNPEHELMKKIILGDKSDNIPKLKARVGKVTVAKIIDAGVDQWLEENNLKEKFMENFKLISFDCIPQMYVEDINEAVKSFKPGNFSGKKFTQLVINEGMTDIFEKVSEYIEVLKKVQ